jgi:5-bromo-4-chloroindolyl phosphate hydrolysis protein
MRQGLTNKEVKYIKENMELGVTKLAADLCVSEELVSRFMPTIIRKRVAKKKAVKKVEKVETAETETTEQADD